ncbi:hypothetical protein V8E36_008795 [Tilletia maclaganii]
MYSLENNTNSIKLFPGWVFQQFKRGLRLVYDFFFKSRKTSPSSAVVEIDTTSNNQLQASDVPNEDNVDNVDNVDTVKAEVDLSDDDKAAIEPTLELHNAPDGDPLQAPASAPPPRAPAIVDHVIAADTKMTVKITALALASAAAHAPVPRRVTVPPWTPGKKFTNLKAEEAKDLLRRFAVQLASTQNQAHTNSNPVNIGADSHLQDKIFEHGVTSPSSATAMQASSTPSPPSEKARMGLFANAEATAPTEKQYKARDAPPTAFDDGMGEKAMVTIEKPLVSAPQVFAHLASFDSGTKPTQATVASIFKTVKSPDLFRACPAGTLTPSQHQLSLATPRAVLSKPTLLAPLA